ncbi:MAG: T9SS type A sorting domain-containing protein, partial [candidate division Zixibacteria bacterium]|nr:T9SS type A sorting domain-containing protein [candidate division Zixibacteria bacterium]
MRRLSYVFALATTFMLLLSFNAFGTGVGDYCVHISNGITPDVAYINFANVFEIHIANDAVLGGMSPAIEITIDNPSTWNLTYGLFPAPPDAPPHYIIQEDPAVAGVWTLPYLQVVSDFNLPSPNHLMLGGAAMSGGGLPISATSRLCYSCEFTPTGAEVAGNFVWVVPYFYPPAGTWTFADPGGYPPDFCGTPVASEANPVAPPVKFPILAVVCQPPIWVTTPAATVSRNHCMDYDFTFLATEGGNIPPANPVTYTATLGTIGPTSGAFHMAAPDLCGSDPVTVTATNTCGGVANYPFAITWTGAAPSITDYPTGTPGGKVAKGNPWSYTLVATDPDLCDNLTWSVVWVSTDPAPPNDPPVGGYGITNLGMFTFNTHDNDGDKTFTFEATVDDNSGCAKTTASVQFTVEVLATEPFLIQIEKTHMTLQGHYEYVSIWKIMGSELMGGFDFLIGYDASALTFMSATIGAAIDPGGCGWEYFTYRFGPMGNCTGPCPSGFARFVAIADQNNGPNHPTCFLVPNGGELVNMKFLVTNDHTFNGMYVPIRFVWQDCGDNGISSMTGDTLWISYQVFDYEWTGSLTDPNYEITGIDTSFGFGFYFGGAHADCAIPSPDPLKPDPLRFIIFWNGGIDIADHDSIDARGDINLDGLANTIADAVLYTNYFLYGIGVFHIALDGQIAASDVNNDGLVLTVGDLVYLIRIIVGDDLPYPKLAPFASTVDVNVANGAVSTDAASDLGAVHAIFNVNGAYDIVNHTDMDLLSAESNGELRVLVYSGFDNMTNRIPTGENDLFTVNGDVELVRVEIADYNGNMLTANVSKTALPQNFSLCQNVPNPFNPTTKITLELPEITDWSLGIYNVAGQLVKSFNGTDEGSVTVTWDASNVASGIYFYRVTTDKFTDTKKMILM